MIKNFPLKKYNSIIKFYKDYLRVLNECLHKIDEKNLFKISNEIQFALENKKKIFV